MHSSGKHIISTFKWDTSFDRKEQAVDLQRRISSWSRIRLHREITDILDDLCPQDQIWKINSLQLDLGEIPFENLEADLSGKLRTRLREKLIDLIIASSNPQSEVEILNSKDSQLEQIRFFLLHGISAWSYKPDEGTINDLFAVQLNVNNRELLHMLKQAGVTHENVRKRMAWQLSEANLKRIIRGLEPTNYSLVTDFSAELIKIQSKESIVKAGTQDFKRNVWFWIINHLLTERGSIFNKVVFMRSNIRQMANHYNVAYKELLQLIVTAVNHVSTNTSVRSDFFRVIRFLSEEDYVESSATDITYQAKDKQPGWSDIGQFLADAKDHYSISKKKEFNEALVNLAAGDPDYFSALISGLTDNPGNLKKRLDDLNETALILVFEEVSKNRQASYAEAVRLIRRLAGTLKLNEAEIWRTGISFFLERDSVKDDLKLFVDYLVSYLAKKSKTSKEQILSKLIRSGVPENHRSVSSLEVMEQLVLMQGDSDVSAVQKFRDKLLLLFDLISTKKIHTSSEKLILTEKILSVFKNVPSNALQILSEYKNKKKELTLILSLLDERTILEILKKSTVAGAPFLLMFYRNLVDSDRKTYSHTLFHVLMRRLPETGMMQLIYHSDFTEHSFINGIKEELIRKSPVSMHSELDRFFRSIESGNHPAGNTVEEVLPETDAERKLSLSVLTPFNTAHVLKSIKEGNDLWILGKYLRHHFKDSGFVNVRKNNRHKDIQIILDSLIADGMNLCEQMVVNPVYLKMLHGLKTAADRQNLLREIFWKCAVNYELHQGNKLQFRRMFEQVLSYEKLPYDTTHSFTKPSLKKPVVSDKNPVSNVKTENGFQHAELNLEAILTGKKISRKQSVQEVSLSEAVTSLLNQCPKKLREILIRIPVTRKRIEMLMRAVSLDQLMQVPALVSGIMDKEEIKSIRGIFHLAQELVSDTLLRELEFLCWKYIWQRFKESKSWQAGYKKLVHTILEKILLEEGVTSDLVIQVIRKQSGHVTGTLKQVLSALMPAALTDQKNEHTATLDKIEKGGLMEIFYDKLLWTGELPFWFESGEQKDSAYWLEKLVKHDPDLLLERLKRKKLTDPDVLVLHRFLGFENLASAVSDSAKSQQPLMAILQQAYNALGRISFTSVSVAEVRLIVFKKLLVAWTTNNWRIVSVASLLTELIWELSMTKGVSKKDFLADLSRGRFMLPVSLQVSLDAILEKEQRPMHMLKEIPVKPIKKTAAGQPGKQAEKRTGIAVRNAGLVLVCGYVSMLFERLGIVAERRFTGSEQQKDAVHFLQYVATGLCKTEEPLLPLNKILCGLDLSDPVHDELVITSKQKELIGGLIKAIIGHWPVIGDCSIEGFRGNWLVRDGILFESEDKWELTVEKRAYDVLIHKSPFSFSIIKYPWMPKPLHVNWPY